jgi:hypothetical protein
VKEGIVKQSAYQLRHFRSGSRQRQKVAESLRAYPATEQLEQILRLWLPAYSAIAVGFGTDDGSQKGDYRATVFFGFA